MNTTFQENNSEQPLNRVAIKAGDWVERVGRFQADPIALEDEIVFGTSRAAWQALAVGIEKGCGSIGNFRWFNGAGKQENAR
jgi:hypothetical protein